MAKEFVTSGHQFVGSSEATNAKGVKEAKATTQVLLAENGNRVAVFLSNPSSKEVWVSLGPTAAKEEGIWLKKETTLPYPIIGYNGVISFITTEGEGKVTFSEI
jgi:hypothetical protein